MADVTDYLLSDAEFMDDLPALRRCARCSKPQDEHARMMRCSRCITELYCNTECQGAAWPVHRLFCHRVDRAAFHADVSGDSQFQHFGFRDAVEFQQALRDFIEAHSFAFRMLAKAELLLRGGLEHMHTPPEIMKVDLQCVSAQDSSTNPALAFKFLGHRWQTIEEHTNDSVGASTWRRDHTLREAITREHFRDPRLIGMLPVIYTVEVPKMQHACFYHQIRPVSSTSIFQCHGDTIEVGMRLVADLVVVCTSSINNGLALRCLVRGPSLKPLPGRFVRANKAWTWRPFFTDWEDYLEGPRRIKTVDDMLSETLHGGFPADVLLMAARMM